MKLNCPEGWELVKLGDLGEVNRGRSRHRPRHAPHLYGGAYPFIQTGDIKASGGRITTFQQTYNEAGLAQSRLWDAGTLCITIAANIAETGILQFPACFPDSVIGFVANPKKCDVQFIEYTFRNIKRLIQHAAKDGGTVQDNINLGTFETLRFPIPKEVEEQHAIARILGALDDKIFLNLDITRTLEAMAQSIFKSWFVDFEPVIAKAAGRIPVGMNAATAALFPSRFVESELGLIPEGWRVVPISEIVKVSRASLTPSDYPSEVFAHFSIPAFDERQTPVHETGDQIKSNKFVVPESSILLSKLNPHTPRVWLPDLEVGYRWIASTEFVVCNTAAPISPGYLFCMFQDPSFQGEFGCLVTGTSNSHQRVKPTDFVLMKVLSPNDEVVKAFTNFAQPMLGEVLELRRQSRTLAALRDSLLPKLLSGEIRVDQAEKVMAETV